MATNLPWSPVIKYEFEYTVTIGALECDIVFRRCAIRSNDPLMERGTDVGVEHGKVQLNVVRREWFPR